MFLHDFAYVELPRETVLRYLTGEGAARVTALAARAAVEGEALCRHIDPDAPGPALAGEAAVVSVGTPQDLGEVTLVPLVWRAAPSAPPMATADLELAPLGPARTQLTLLGRAAESGGPVAVHRRVLQATMRWFLLRLARDLEDAAGPAGVPLLARPLSLAG